MDGIFRNYVTFHILFFFVYIIFILSPQELLAQSPATGNVCDKVNCGQGKCVANGSNDTILQSFDCICNEGWKKMQVGPFTFPACTVPNCTVNFECGNGTSQAPPPPPPPPPPTSSLININPCMIAWCGDGTCVADGLGYECKCNEGSSNLLNLTAAACFKECALGTDCNGVALGSPSSSETSSSTSTSGNYYTSFSPPPSGSNEVANCTTRFGQFVVLSLCLIFVLISNLTWG